VAIAPRSLADAGLKDDGCSYLVRCAHKWCETIHSFDQINPFCKQLKSSSCGEYAQLSVPILEWLATLK
jgi:hypothetical protein